VIKCLLCTYRSRLKVHINYQHYQLLCTYRSPVHLPQSSQGDWWHVFTLVLAQLLLGSCGYIRTSTRPYAHTLPRRTLSILLFHFDRYTKRPTKTLLSISVFVTTRCWPFHPPGTLPLER
jgi:hypothetical protein